METCFLALRLLIKLDDDEIASQGLCDQSRSFFLSFLIPPHTYTISAAVLIYWFKIAEVRSKKHQVQSMVHLWGIEGTSSAFANGMNKTLNIFHVVKIRMEREEEGKCCVRLKEDDAGRFLVTLTCQKKGKRSHDVAPLDPKCTAFNNRPRRNGEEEEVGAQKKKKRKRILLSLAHALL